MPAFSYKATDKDGKIKAGTILASSKKEAVHLLVDQKIKVLSIQEQKEKPASFLTFQKFSLKEKINLCRYLSLIINAGISLDEAFELITAGTTNKTVKKVLEDISFSLKQGKSLYSIFSKYPQFFDDVFLVMIKTGESSGTLSQSFDHLGKQYRQELRLKQNVVGALTYPLVIIGLMLAVGVLILSFVLPKLAHVFLRMKLDLPLYTRFLFNFSLFLEKNLLVVVFFSLILLSVFFIFLKSKIGKGLLNALVKRLPIFKNIILEYNLVRFNQSLSALLAAGVPITQSLEMAVGTLSFVKSKDIAMNLSEKLTRGVSLATVFTEAKIFPPLMIQMVQVGEKTGTLENILADLSSFYQEEVENSLKSFVAILEPILMILVGIGVGFMVLSVITPIYSLINQLQAVP